MKKAFSTLLAILTAAVVLTGCSGGTSSNSQSDAQSDASVSDTASDVSVSDTASDTSASDTSASDTAEDGTITVTHALGTTVIPEKPERVATIAWCNHDVALALGVAPVGVSRMNFAVDETGIFPWAWEKFKALGVEDPVVFEDIDGLDYEAIADTDPDVILAGYSGITREEYDRLSEIAPVVAYPQGAWISTWREQTLINGEGMGMKAEAEQLIADTEKLLAEKVAQYPAIEGKSIAFCWFSAEDLGTFYIYTNNDPRAAYLNDLGFVVPASVEEAASTDPSAFSITVSAENADQFSDVDVIITYGDEALLEAMQADARLGSIPAVQNGAVVLLDSNDVVAASSTPSILSIPYMIDEYLELLNAAAEKAQ